MDPNRDRPKVVGDRGRLGTAGAERQAKGEVVPAGSIWTHFLKKCAPVSLDGWDLGRVCREEGAAGTEVWRQEQCCVFRARA